MQNVNFCKCTDTNLFVVLCYPNSSMKFYSVRLHSNARTTSTLRASAHLLAVRLDEKNEISLEHIRIWEQQGTMPSMDIGTFLKPFATDVTIVLSIVEALPKISQPIWAAGSKFCLHSHMVGLTYPQGYLP